MTHRHLMQLWGVWFLSVALWMMAGRSVPNEADGLWVMVNLGVGLWLSIRGWVVLRRG